jgi:hypothetical protein
MGWIFLVNSTLAAWEEEEEEWEVLVREAAVAAAAAAFAVLDLFLGGMIKRTSQTTPAPKPIR